MVRVSVLATLALSAGIACGCAKPQDRPPNVILVSLDTVRPDHLSLYGYERETSPFLEELAAESVVYTRAYAAASWTLLSHMTMLTGVYPGTHGVEKDLALAHDVPLLAQRLRDASYYNVGIYYDGWIAPRFGFDRGFDVFEPRRSAGAAEAAMVAALDERPKSRPLFLFLHLFDAHCGNLTHPDSTIYDSTPRYSNLFREGAAERMRGRPVHDIYYGKLRPTMEEAQDIIALYDGGVRFLDDKLRKWVGRWREEGLLDDAILIVTSDHGEALGQHGQWNGHGGFYENGLRVPLLVRYPDGRGAGTRDERLTSSVDLVPTVLELLGLEHDPWLPGRSLLDRPRTEGEVILAERDRQRIVTNGRFKMLSHVDRGALMVWNLEVDPGERRALEREDARPMRHVLNSGLRELLPIMAATPGAPIPVGAASDETRAELEALGYAGD